MSICVIRCYFFRQYFSWIRVAFVSQLQRNERKNTHLLCYPIVFNYFLCVNLAIALNAHRKLDVLTLTFYVFIIFYSSLLLFCIFEHVFVYFFFYVWIAFFLSCTFFLMFRPFFHSNVFFLFVFTSIIPSWVLILFSVYYIEVTGISIHNLVDTDYRMRLKLIWPFFVCKKIIKTTVLNWFDASEWNKETCKQSGK